MKKLITALLAMALAFSIAPAVSADPVYPAEWEFVGSNFFQPDSAKLTFSAKQKLRKIVRENSGVEFEITGYAKFGESKDRGYLSRTRALNVKRFIRDLGVTSAIKVRAAWAPDDKGNKKSARRAEIRVKDLGQFSLTLPDLYVNDIWICPYGWAIYSGEVVLEDLMVESEDVIDTKVYETLCSSGEGFTHDDFPADTYTVVLAYAADASCDTDVLGDTQYIGYWERECFEQIPGVIYYFHTVELNSDTTLEVPDWSNLG